MDNTRRENILYKCDYCDYETSKKNYLDQHVKRVHLNERPFECDDCDYTSATKLGFQVDAPTRPFILVFQIGSLI